MKKELYKKPALQVVEIQQTYRICEASLHNVSGNAGLGYSGDGSDDAKSRSFDADYE